MNHSTFSAQVANNLLTLLQGYTKGIRLLLVMLLTLTVSANAWGAALTGNYTKITNISNLSAGDRVVLYADDISKGVTGWNGNKDATVSESGWVEYLVESASGGVYLKDENADNYIASPGSSNQFQYGTKAVCTVNENGVLKCNNRFLVQNSAYYRMYSSIGTYKPFYVYKISIAAPSYDITVKSNNDAYGSVSISGKTITATPKDGYRVKSGDAGYTVTSGTAVVTNNDNNTFSVTPSSNCTITINFETIPKYTVTWNVNGEVYETTQVTEGSKPTFPATPSSCDATSNTFYGWATATWDGKINDVSAKTIYTSANNMPVGAATYHAVFCDGGGGSVLINEPFDNNSTSDLSQAFSSSTFPNFSGETEKAYKSKYGGVKFGTSSAVGYITSKSLDLSTAFTVTLDACKYGSDAGNIVVTIGSQSKTIANSSLGAAGTFNTYTLEFDAATATSTVKIGTSSKRAYIDNVIIATGGGASNFITTCATGDPCDALQAPNVTAIATANSITLSWEAVSGATSYNIYNFTTDTEDETTELTYTFTGLSSETEYEWEVESAKGECFKGTQGTTTTLAEAPNTYTITYVTNDGRKIDPMTEQTALPDPLPTTTRDHYTFAGWFTDEGCTQAATAGAQINANTTLYAKWTPITYTVTFDAGSGTYTSGDIQGNFETGITLPTATPCPYASNSGWSFVGWSESTVSETTVRPTIYAAESNYKPTNTILLHAVYAKTSTAQGAAGEFILSLEYKSTTYYVGQTFDNSKLSAETDQNNAARFTIEDNYLHYEGGYISHVATQSSTNITRQANKGDAQAWTIAENGNTITFTSTADATRGLGFNYNDGSPRFAAYKLNEKDGETIKYPSTFTKTSVSGGNVQVTTYNSNPSCAAPVDPTWQPAEINHSSIQVVCGSKTLLNAADPNGPATISFSGTNLVNPVTVTASDGFFVSTDKVNDAGYKSEVTITPHKEGQNVGKLQNVYVIAQAPAQSGDFTGTITLTGADITGGPQVINVTADVTCTTYTITWSVDGDTELIAPTTFYAGGDWTLPENPIYECNGREFVGWTNTEIVQPQDNAPYVLYKEQGEFPTIERDITFYAVFAKAGDNSGGNTGSTKTVTLPRPTKAASGYQVGTTVDSEGNTWSYYATLNNQSGTLCYGLNSHLNNYHISSPNFGGTITSISFKAYNGSSSANRKFLFCSSNTTAQPTIGDLAEVTIPKSESFSQIYTADLSQLGVNQFHIYVAAALSITDIAVTYTTGSSTSSTTYTSYTTSCADVKAIRIVEPTTKIFNEGDKFVFDGEVWAINSDDSETDVTNSPSVHFDVDMHKVGEQTVTVSYLGFTATYGITINAVDKWNITWYVNGATNTGLSPRTVVQGEAISTLPEPTIPDVCEGKIFMGWSTTRGFNSDGSDFEPIKAGIIPTENTTYYAVFAQQSDNGGAQGDQLFSESFDDVEGSGANGDDWSGNVASAQLGTFGDWTHSFAYKGNQCIKLGKGDSKGSATTPALGIDGTATLSFSAGAWNANNEGTGINLIIVGEGTITPSSITLNKGQFDTYTATINGANADTKVQFVAQNASNNRFFLDEVSVHSGSNVTYTDYSTSCGDFLVTYYGFNTGGYTTICGDNPGEITVPQFTTYTIPTCTPTEDPQGLKRTFAGTWVDGAGKSYKPGDSFEVTKNTTLYAQWTWNTNTIPTDDEGIGDLATTDIVVTGGNTLTLAEGTTTINSLTLKGGLQENGSYAMPVVNIPEGATLVRNNNKINLDLKVNNNSYYPFAVPFEVANTAANVNYINPTLKEYANANQGYGKFYRILEYNGALRAENGVNSAENWVHVGRTDVKLMPGKGYAISAVPAAGDDTVTIRITMNVDNAWLANGEQESITVKEQTTTRNAVAVTAYTGAAATEHTRHAGWNFVANPYLANFAGTNASNEGGSFINGEILINNGEYSYGGETVPYVTIPTYNFAHYYQLKLSEATLSPAYSFFVQVGEGGTMSFADEGRQAAPAGIAARNAEERPVKMDVDITLSDNHSSDQTGIIISDRYSDAYEIGRDLEKMFGSAANLTVYTLMADNTPLAYQALAIRSNMQVIPVGYRAPEQGEYTFALNTNTSSIDLLNEQYEQLVLVDYQTGELTNLLIADYTFYSERVQSDSRFALYAVPRQNAPTDLPNALGSGSDTQKVLHNGHLYILHNGSVYNGNGQIVK